MRKSSGRFRPEVCGELARDFSVFRLLPRAFFLNEFRLLSQDRVLLKVMAALELVIDLNAKAIILDPLSKLSVGKLFHIRIQQCRIGVGSCLGLG